MKKKQTFAQAARFISKKKSPHASKETKPLEIEALAIVIPSRIADKKLAVPYDIKEVPCKCGSKDHATIKFVCRECGEEFFRRRSWEKHKGIRWIKASYVEICK